MPLNIPPLEWPKIYNMVNLGGIDLATANGTEVPGIYQKITAALTSDHIEVFYNWKFADIVLPPSKVVIDVSVANQYTINEEILVKSDDTVGIIGFIRIPIIVPLTAEENAVYDIPVDADGFGPVTVQVPIPPPTLVSLNANENGTYTPATGVDGFDEVVVNVPDIPPVLETLSATQNGNYTPSQGKDGFSEVTVNVQPDLETLSATQNGNYTPSQEKDGFSEVTVNVQPTLQSISVSENGTYTPTTGYDGFSSVVVEVAGGSELPSAYQQVEYIECTAAQYFRFLSSDLPGKVCNLVVSKTSSTGDRSPLATSPEKAWSATFTGMTIKIYNSAGGICYGENVATSYTVTSGVKNGYLVKLPTGITGLNVGEYRYDTHNELFDGKIYEFVIYDNTLAVYRKFIPCRRKSDNVAGFYEIKTETFCISESSTPFIAGNDI